MAVNDPCVSISTGTLSPDLRVNYAYGMVLGLGEFLQEQQYFLQKDYLHERALHGFGTVYGLQVTAEPTDGASTDWTISVTPGMAIDQWGREVVIRSAQCARLGAWLGEQEQTNPGTIAANLGVSGELTVYVVAKYAECLDNLVPLPGQPCSSSAQTSVASRIRDAWDIELQWNPPLMPEWDTDRRLARLLNAVQIVPHLDPSLSSEPEIIEAVRALPADVDAGPEDLWPLVDWPTVSSAPSGPVVWQIPAETASDVLDRIFTVWVTQVRPLLSPSLTSPPTSWDPSILLTTIHFTLGPLISSAGTDPAIASVEEPDDTGRPYVLHTRLIQELRILSEGGVTTTTAQELATISSAVDANGGLSLTAWFHLDQPVELTEGVSVTSRSGTTGLFDVAAQAGPDGVVPTFADVWLLTPHVDPSTGVFPVIDRDQLAVSFAPAVVLVGDPGTTLAQRIHGGLDLLDALPSGDVVVYTTVDLPPTVLPVPVQAVPPVQEFVTISPGRAVLDAAALSVEFWFHPQFHAGNQPQVVIGKLEPEVMSYTAESQPGTRVPAVSADQSSSNVWDVTFRETQEGNGYLRFLFLAAKIPVTLIEPGGNQGESLTLVEWMEKAGFTFIGYDPERQTISAYFRVAGVVK